MAPDIYCAPAVIRIRIPDKHAIMGFGEIETADVVTPRHTTINISIVEIWLAPVDKLNSLIKKNDKNGVQEICKKYCN